LKRRDLLGAALAAPLACQTGCESGEYVDDVSQLNRTKVRQILRPRTTQAVVEALSASGGAVCIGGARYSMGGQIVALEALHLDMRMMNRLVWLDAARQRVRVQAGMRWRDLQALVDPLGLAVAIMQSYSNFSVGGSVAVNCHGRYVGKGALVHSVVALELIDAAGRVRELDRTQNQDLFFAVVGGYGGLGVVTEVELELAINDKIQRKAEWVALAEYPDYFRERVQVPGSVLHNADLAPPRFDRPLAVTWSRSEAPLTDTTRLRSKNADYGRDQNLIWAASELPIGEAIRVREMSKHLLELEPVVWRNNEASLDTDALEPRTRRVSTYLLQEYFIPEAAFATFATELQRTLARFEVNALNVSIRHAPPDLETYLSWASEAVFSFVLYYKQRSFAAADAASAVWTRRLIDAALACNGRFYLPYRLHATPSQFRRAYPRSDQWLALKAGVDPDRRFQNALWQAYGGGSSA